MKILFLAKDKPLAKDAADLVINHFERAQIIFGDRHSELPKEVYNQSYDYVISYISPWILPKEILESVKIAAINFHPGPPNYPGIGCTNFAIYHDEKEYGITVHHMAEKVDTGAIILVERFSIYPEDTVYSLTQRCYAHIYIAFTKIFEGILKEQPLPKSKEHWQRKPFTRNELNELCRINPGMDKEEINRRVKATAFPGMPGANWETTR